MDKEMTEYALWYDYTNRWAEDGLSYVIDTNEISEAVYLGDYTMVIEGVNVDEVDIDILMDRLNQYEKDHFNFSRGDEDGMKEFFKSIGYKNAEPTFVEGYGKVENVLVYDFNGETFGNQADSEARCLVHENCNGEILEFSEEMKKTIIKVKPESVSLDELDGSKWYSNYPFDNQEIFKIQEIDDVAVDDKYLLMYTTQYGEIIPAGKILDWMEVKKYVEELGQYVEEYIEELKKLD